MMHTAVCERPLASSSTDADDVPALVAAAQRNDNAAWNRLIARYTPLVTSVARGYRLATADVEDITQTVWLRCFQNLHALRDPRALPGWLKTTTHHEALRLLNSGNRADVMARQLLDRLIDNGDMESPEVASELLKEEVIRTIRSGLDELHPKEQQLLRLLHAPTPPSYTEISEHLGIPRGSIGPSRARYLAKLRHTPTMAGYLDQDDLLLGA